MCAGYAEKLGNQENLVQLMVPTFKLLWEKTKNSHVCEGCCGERTSALENIAPKLQCVSSPPQESEQWWHFLPSEMQPKLIDDPRNLEDTDTAAWLLRIHPKLKDCG